MMLAHDDPVVSAFLDDKIKNLEGYKYVQYTSNTELTPETLSASIMYYTKVIVEIHAPYDYRKFQSLCELEIDGVVLLFVFSDYRSISSAKTSAIRKSLKVAEVTIRTIPKELVMLYLQKILKTTYLRKLDTKLLNKVYRHLYYSSDITKELTAIGLSKSLKNLEVIVTRTSITNNNFAYHLFARKYIPDVMTYIYTQANSLEYICAIITNWLEQVEKLYGVWKTVSGDKYLYSQYFVEHKKEFKYVDVRDIFRISELFKDYSFEEIYTLRGIASNLNSRMQKQIFIMRLISNAHSYKV